MHQDHEGSSQMRRLCLGESTFLYVVKVQVKLLFHCVPSADLKSIGYEHCTAENVYIWLKIQDIASLFSPSAKQQLSQESEIKWPDSQLICNGIPLDTCLFIIKCSVSVCFLDRKVKYCLSPSLPIQTTKLLMNVPTGMGKPLKVDLISLTNKPYWCMTSATGYGDHKWDEVSLCQPVWFMCALPICHMQTSCCWHLTFMIESYRLPLPRRIPSQQFRMMKWVWNWEC